MIHDFLYATKGTGVWGKKHKGVVRAAPYTRLEADNILKEAMADRAIGSWEPAVIWSAVRAGGVLGALSAKQCCPPLGQMHDPVLTPRTSNSHGPHRTYS